MQHIKHKNKIPIWKACKMCLKPHNMVFQIYFNEPDPVYISNSVYFYILHQNCSFNDFCTYKTKASELKTHYL